MYDRTRRVAAGGDSDTARDGADPAAADPDHSPHVGVNAADDAGPGSLVDKRTPDSDSRSERGAVPTLRGPPAVGRAMSDPIELRGHAEPAPPALPYGPKVTRMLPLLDRGLRVMNRWYVIPAIKAGLGPLHANPLTGSWMLLRTTGRRTGRVREVALGYAILDGAVYCSAGLGPTTAWYRNLVADPAVEVVLPGAAFAGTAEAVTDPGELDRAWRALIRSLGVLGGGLVCAPDAPPDEVAAKTANLPLVRIRPTGIAPGPADPGGRFWVTVTVVGLAWLIVRRGRGWRRRP